MATASANNGPPSKTDFVRRYLDGNPMAGVRAVNEAWTAAGHEGSISDTLVHRLRSEKGLTGNLRGGARASGRKRPPKPKARRGRPARSATLGEAAPAAPALSPGEAGVDAGTLEAEFDRLLFRVMGHGMPDVEEAIRAARRLLVLHEGR